MQGRGRDRLAEALSQNNEAVRKAQRSDVGAASWIKVAIFGLPVIVIVIGVIWASSLD